MSPSDISIVRYLKDIEDVIVATLLVASVTGVIIILGFYYWVNRIKKMQSDFELFRKQSREAWKIIAGVSGTLHATGPLIANMEESSEVEKLKRQVGELTELLTRTQEAYAALQQEVASTKVASASPGLRIPRSGRRDNGEG
jgi:hypothetical protein